MGKKLSLDTVGSIGSGLSSIIGNSVNSSNIQDTSLIENYINSQKDSIKGLVDNNSLLANFQNYNMDYINSSDLENPNASMNTLKSAASGAVTGLTVGGPIGAAIGGLLGFGSGILGEVSGANAANREAERLNNMIDDMKNAYIAQIDRVEKKNDQRILANIQKDGGKINIAPSKKGTFTAAAKRHGKSVQAFASQVLANKDNYSSAMVKKANFARNASKWKHADGGYVDGMTSMMKARLALADHFGNPTARRMTYRDTREYQFPNGDRGNVFVSSYDNYVTPHIQDVNGKLTYIENPWEGEENTKRSLQQSIKFDRPEDAIYFGKHYKDIAPMMKYNWKKHGGPITHGLEIDNGITTINNGGTHEENPYEGVQIGVDNQGIPNLVEEGEVVWNDYVFSNRLKPTKEMKKKNKYKGDTFAEVAKYLQKESEERPNDPISKNGLEASLRNLTALQEQVRDTKESKSNNKNKFVNGGTTENYIKNGYLTDYSNFLTTPTIYPSALALTSSDTAPSKNKLQGISRYAPVVGSVLGVLGDTLGVTNQPDYSNANMIGDAVKNLQTVDWTPVGNYITYNPFDRNYYSNKLGAQAAATRRAIKDMSGGNRATALAGLLAADYNAQTQLGNLYRQAEEYNQEQKQKVTAFNNAVDQYNAEGALKASMANMENNKLRLQAVMEQAKLRDQIESAASSARSSNLSSLWSNLGNLGTDNMNRADAKMVIEKVFKGLSPEEQAKVLQLFR